MLKLMAALEEDGVFIFTAGGLDVAGFHVDASMGPEVYYSTLGINGLLQVIEEAGCVLRHLEFDQLPHNIWWSLFNVYPEYAKHDLVHA